MLGLEEALTLYIWARWFFNLPLPFVRRAFRKMGRQHLLLHYRDLHTGVMHGMRELSGSMLESPINRDLVGRNAIEVCKNCTFGMGSMLKLTQFELSCSMKVYDPDNPSIPALKTWARSGVSERPERSSFTAENSTIYAALNGGFDGVTHWEKFTTFCCNDLEKYGAKFRCYRQDWPKYYKSTLVLPIKYIHNHQGKTVTDSLGYLAFDSPKKGAFEDVPEIFEHMGEPQNYRNKLEHSAAFHLGAIYADAWSTFMQPMYNRTA